jgi:surface protein
MEAMFQGAASFKQEVGSWNGTAASSMQKLMFERASAFQEKFWCPDEVEGPPIWCACKTECPAPPPSPPPSSNPPAPKTTITRYNFEEAIKTCLWSDGGIYVVNGMCSRIEYGAMPDWDVRLVPNMASAFAGNEEFNADISKWDVGGVTDMSGMFNGSLSFNQNFEK